MGLIKQETAFEYIIYSSKSGSLAWNNAFQALEIPILLIRDINSALRLRISVLFLYYVYFRHGVLKLEVWLFGWIF